jgi:predicted unusual protein kinase regulating ubiquinone biosynthesis (AarF/ABC1/UbiB family)
MMLVDNLIHSDLHPGNILVRLEQPHGLVGVAYKAITALANPEGLPMKALASALDRLSSAARQSPDSSSGGGGSVTGTAADAGATAVSQQQPQQQLQAVSSSTKARAWLSQMRSAWATGGPSALLSTLQAQLSSVAAAWLQPHIVLLDVGMATELSPEDQHNMVGLFR